MSQYYNLYILFEVLRIAFIRRVSSHMEEHHIQYMQTGRGSIHWVKFAVSVSIDIPSTNTNLIRWGQVIKCKMWTWWKTKKSSQYNQPL